MVNVRNNIGTLWNPAPGVTFKKRGVLPEPNSLLMSTTTGQYYKAGGGGSAASNVSPENLVTGEQPQPAINVFNQPTQPKKDEQPKPIFTEKTPTQLGTSSAIGKYTLSTGEVTTDRNRAQLDALRLSGDFSKTSQPKKIVTKKETPAELKQRFSTAQQKYSKETTFSQRLFSGTIAPELKDEVKGGTIPLIGIKGAGAVGRGASLVKNSKAGQYLYRTGVGALRTIGIQEGARRGTEQLSRSTADKDIKALYKGGVYDQLVKAGFRGEEASIYGKVDEKTGQTIQKGQAWYKQAAYSGLPTFLFNDKAYNKAVTDKAKELGINEELALRATKRQRITSGLGETIGFVSGSASIEKMGRFEQRLALNALGRVGARETTRTAPKKLFFLTASRLAPLGAIEGGLQEYGQQMSRRQELNLKSIGLSSGLGAGSAALIGGGISALSVNKPGSSKALEWAANISDYSEKPGDIIADIAETGQRKILKQTIKEPQIFRTVPKGQVITFSAPVGGVSTSTKTRTTPTKTQITTPTLESIIGGNRRPISNIPNDIIIPTDTNKGKGQTTPISPNTNIPTSITNNPFTNTETSTVSSNVNVFAPINIPTVTPQLKIPPPLPLNLGFMGGYGGVRKGKVKRYANELRAAGNLFARFAGRTQRPKNNKTKSKKKRRYYGKTKRK